MTASTESALSPHSGGALRCSQAAQGPGRVRRPNAAPRRCPSCRGYRSGSPTSSSWGTRSAAPRRCTRCCAAIRRSTCPRSRNRSSSRASCRLARTATARRRRFGSISPCSTTPRPGSVWARPPPPICGLPPRRAGSPRSPPTRGSSRSCASPPASCARCTCSVCNRVTRPSATCVGRLRWRRPGAGGRACRGARAGRRCCSTPITCATSSSCAAMARCSPPSRCWC